MNGRTSSARVLVLRLTPNGESFLKLEVIGADCGALLCLQRISRKGPQKARPELFDSADLELEAARSGSLQFVRDYLPVRRREAIGRSYRSLEAASRLCGLLAENAPQMPEPAPLHDLAQDALDALADGKQPAIVLLKAFFRLARDEGYPVRENWWPALPADLRTTVAQVLGEPAPTEAPAPLLDECRRAVEGLAEWLARDTDLVVPG